MPTLTGFLQDNTGVFIVKDSAATLTYTLDWTDWLGGTTISSSTFTVETITGDAAPLTRSSQSNTTTATTVKLAAGTAGNIYKISNTITTSGSLTERRFFRVKVDTRSL